ncbi:hypothetical protein AAG747_04800 [Rapidithrix thailandica]|uniref:TonB C-terminal domain-containing protein n=1 Tax=Rapidithrix thailandica TaxID=413964 RepID=A0AAW9RR19_9BACT
MKKTAYSILFCLGFWLTNSLVNQANAQIFKDCNLPNLQYFVDEMPSFSEDGGLKAYFEKELGKKVEEYTGHVMLQILIANDGTPCCKSIINKSNQQNGDMNLKKLINKMPKWKAASKKNQAVNSVAYLTLRFEEGQLNVEYDRM